MYGSQLCLFQFKHLNVTEICYVDNFKSRQLWFMNPSNWSSHDIQWLQKVNYKNAIRRNVKPSGICKPIMYLSGLTENYLEDICERIYLTVNQLVPKQFNWIDSLVHTGVLTQV